MSIRSLPLWFRVVLAALVPMVALVILGFFQVQARANEASAARQELVRTQAIEMLALVQSANILPEAILVASEVEANPNGLLGGVIEQQTVGLAMTRYVGFDGARELAPPEVQASIGPELTALFDRQRASIAALSAATWDGGLPQLVDEALATRDEVDAALSVFFQSSSSDAWLVYAATLDALRESWIEYIYYTPALRGHMLSSISDLNRLTGRRQLATERVSGVLPLSLRPKIEAVLNSPTFANWSGAVDSLEGISDGTVSGPNDLTFLLLSTDALSLANEIEILADEAVTLVREDLIAAADQADEQRRELSVLVLVLVSITLGLSAVILQSLLGPLRSLTARARSLAEGRLEENVSQISGRDELTRLAITIEDVASGLRHLDRQVRAIADGDLEDPSLQQAAPGPVGAYVQQRMEALRKASGALLAEAGTDSLTGLLNRRGLLDTLNSQDAQRRESDRAGQRAIVFVDLDKFKAVNDDYGHKHGDAVLVAVARRLQQFVRANDVVARLGGDEFVLVSDGFDPQSVNLLLERVESHLAQPVEFDGVTHNIGCSVGMAWLDQDTDLADAIDVADRRMLAVKAERGSARR